MSEENINQTSTPQQAQGSIGAPVASSPSDDYANAFDGIQNDEFLQNAFPAVKDTNWNDLRSTTEASNLTSLLKQRGMNRTQANLAVAMARQAYLNGITNAEAEMRRQYEEYEQARDAREKKVDDAVEATKNIAKRVFEQSGAPVTDEELQAIDHMVRQDPNVARLFLDRLGAKVQEQEQAQEPQFNNENKMQNPNNLQSNNPVVPNTNATPVYATSGASANMGAYGYDPVSLDNWAERGEQGLDFIQKRVVNEVRGVDEEGRRVPAQTMEASKSFLHQHFLGFTQKALEAMDNVQR